MTDLPRPGPITPGLDTRPIRGQAADDSDNELDYLDLLDLLNDRAELPEVDHAGAGGGIDPHAVAEEVLERSPRYKDWTQPLPDYWDDVLEAICLLYKKHRRSPAFFQSVDHGVRWVFGAAKRLNQWRGQGPAFPVASLEDQPDDAVAPTPLAEETTAQQVADRILRYYTERERVLGQAPDTGYTVVAKVGREGPYITEVLPVAALEVPPAASSVGPPPRQASLFAAMNLDTITLADAVRLLSLPRTVGRASDGEVVIARYGPFGACLVKGEAARPLPQEASLFTITLAEAEALFAAWEPTGWRTPVKPYAGRLTLRYVEAEILRAVAPFALNPGQPLPRGLYSALAEKLHLKHDQVEDAYQRAKKAFIRIHYLIGALGPPGALASDAALDAAVTHFRADFRGQNAWSILTFAAASATARERRDHPDRVGYVVRVDRPLYEAGLQAYPKEIARLRTEARTWGRSDQDFDPVTCLHAVEHLVAQFFGRFDPDCVLVPCPIHTLPGGAL